MDFGCGHSEILNPKWIPPQYFPYFLINKNNLIMKNNRYFPIIASAIALFCFAIGCNEPTKKAEAKQEATKAVEAVVPPAFVPFKIMGVTHTVKDFDVWKKSYDEHESMRVASGLTKLAVCRDMKNPNKVYVFVKMADIQKAKDFAANPNLKAAMEKGGVNSIPSFRYSDVLRFEEVPAAYKERVRIAHKVKDFDAWLKGYDAEGKETVLPTLSIFSKKSLIPILQTPFCH